MRQVDAGLVPAIVVDSYLAEFWQKVFTNVTVHDTVALRTDANLANLYKYCIAYRLIADERTRREESNATLKAKAK